MKLLLGGGAHKRSGQLDLLLSCLDLMLSSCRNVKQVVYVPYASFDYRQSFERMRDEGYFGDYPVVSVEDFASPHDALMKADAVYVGGGNTFLLLKTLQDYDVLGFLRWRVMRGLSYIGLSAGANIASPTIMTTNDMPIVEPRNFRALDVVRFQINPHFPVTEKEEGETRSVRLRRFHDVNKIPVVGLCEGSLLEVTGNDSKVRVRLYGEHGARLFQRGEDDVGMKDDRVYNKNLK